MALITSTSLVDEYTHVVYQFVAIPTERERE